MKIEKYFDDKLKRHLWKIDFTLNGVRHREKEYGSKQAAEDAIIALKALERAKRMGLSLPKKKNVTLSHLYQQREADAQVPNKDAALRVLKEAMDVLKEDLLLIELKRYHIKQITDHFQKRVSIGSVNQYLGLFSASLHAAPAYFAELDDWTPPRIPRLQGATARERVLTRDELSKLFKELNAGDYHADVGDVMRLMLLTGARKKELIGLTLEKINPDWQTTQFLKTKNKMNRTCAMSDLAMGILRRRAGKPLMAEISDHTVWKHARRASEAVGVIYGDQIEGGWVPHDLRHTAATVLETAGVKYSAVAAVLGHKRRDQTATYTHVSLDDLRAAVVVLENWCREIDGFCKEVALNCMTPDKSNSANSQ